ncbi:MAG TPA: LysR family transcriptional regulator [Neobacillus sp.]
MELVLSQPALSRSISRLEEEIGGPLFERKSRGVIVNKYGEIFLQHANRAFSEIESFTEKVFCIISVIIRKPMILQNFFT